MRSLLCIVVLLFSMQGFSQSTNQLANPWNGFKFPKMPKMPDFSNLPGMNGGLGGFGKDISYTLYEPNSLKASKGGQKYPLYIVLHGCLQGAKDIAKSTRFNQLAEEKKFYVLYPEQTMSRNTMRCWNWFEAKDQKRAGEPEMIVKKVREVAKNKNVDLKKIYLVGFSAGGGLASTMLNCYPEFFAGAAIHSGPSYKAATSMGQAFTAMKQGSQTSAPTAAKAGFLCSGGKKQRVVSTFVIHGLGDGIITPDFLQQNLEEIAIFNDYLDDGNKNGSFHLEDPVKHEGSSEGGYAYQMMTWKNEKARLSALAIGQLDHAWSGGARQQYSDPRGPDATKRIWEFFNQ